MLPLQIPCSTPKSTSLPALLFLPQIQYISYIFPRSFCFQLSNLASYGFVYRLILYSWFFFSLNKLLYTFATPDIELITNRAGNKPVTYIRRIQKQYSRGVSRKKRIASKCTVKTRRLNPLWVLKGLEFCLPGNHNYFGNNLNIYFSYICFKSWFP